MQKIKLGIIGAGRMGITHYSIINSHPNVEIESVADPSTPGTYLNEKYLPVKTFKDYNELLKKPNQISFDLYTSKSALPNYRKMCKTWYPCFPKSRLPQNLRQLQNSTPYFQKQTW